MRTHPSDHTVLDARLPAAVLARCRLRRCRHCQLDAQHGPCFLHSSTLHRYDCHADALLQYASYIIHCSAVHVVCKYNIDQVRVYCRRCKKAHVSFISVQSIVPLKAVYTSHLGRHIPLRNQPIFLGSIRPRRNYCEKTIQSLSTAVYGVSCSLIQLSELRRRGENDNARASKQQQELLYVIQQIAGNRRLFSL